MSTSSTTPAARLLGRQLNDIKNSKNLQGISCGLVDDKDMFNWEVTLMINDDCKYYGGAIFHALMRFPPEYPHLPPSLTFQSPVPFHPNIYPHGPLCISILHPPEDDETGYELAAERWSPVQSPESILISVLSVFNDPNEESPANVEAAKLLREDREGKNKEFRKRCRKVIRESLGEE